MVELGPQKHWAFSEASGEVIIKAQLVKIYLQDGCPLCDWVQHDLNVEEPEKVSSEMPALLSFSSLCKAFTEKQSLKKL